MLYTLTRTRIKEIVKVLKTTSLSIGTIAREFNIPSAWVMYIRRTHDINN